MSRCIHVDPNGKFEAVMWNQCTVAQRLGGSVTFVGGIESLNIVFVSLAYCEHGDINPFFTHHQNLFFPCTPPIRGSIVMVASDETGEEMDVDVEQVCLMFDQRLQ